MIQPPNTNTFTYYNANPKGKKTTDCVIRAIRTALNQNYTTTAKELLELQLKTGYDMSDVKCYGKYLKNKGLHKYKQPHKKDNTKYTGSEFAASFKGICVANIGGNHVVCFEDGKILDIWDCSNKCVGNYWTWTDSNIFKLQ